MNVLNQTVQSFDMTAFDEVVKDLRNARRNLLDDSNDTETVNAALKTAQKEMEKAVRTNDIEAYNEKSGEVRRLMKKLSEGSTAHQEKFDAAMDRLAKLAEPLAIVTEVTDEVEADEKQAA